MDYSRNWLFIDDAAQKELASKKLLIAGAGIGSFIAELAVRTGIQNITIADGDIVSESNLNRQNYLGVQVGMNKVESLKSRLLAINPKLNLTIIPQFLGSGELNRLVPEADFVINTIDFDSPAFLECSDLCRTHGVVEFFPMNVGFGAALCIFSKGSPTWRDMFKFENHVDLKQAIMGYLSASQQMESYLYQLADRYEKELPLRQCDPQLGISTYIVAAMTVSNVVKIVQGQEVKLFPEFFYLDAYTDTTVAAIKGVGAA